MSVKDYDKVIQIEDSTIGKIIQLIDYDSFSYETINHIIADFFWKYTMRDEHNLTFKLGYKSH